MILLAVLAGTLLLLVFSLVLLRLAVIVVTVQGLSMSPTLKHGDRVLVWRFWAARWLRRGQIILIRPWKEPAGTPPWIKRIVGMPGEPVDPLLEKLPEYLYSSQLPRHELQGWQTGLIPPKHFFVRGDNRNESVDSLFWGPIPSKNIYGIMFRKLINIESTLEPVRTQVFGQGPSVRLPAPPFMTETIDGEVIDHTSYLGHSVVFLFICPCSLCHVTLTGYDVLALKAAQSRVRFVLVSTADTIQTCSFVTKLNTHLPVLIAPHPKNPFLHDYNISNTPYFCLIDAQGNVQATGFPDMRRGKWKALVEAWERSATVDIADMLAPILRENITENMTHLVQMPVLQAQDDYQEKQRMVVLHNILKDENSCS